MNTLFPSQSERISSGVKLKGGDFYYLNMQAEIETNLIV